MHLSSDIAAMSSFVIFVSVCVFVVLSFSLKPTFRSLSRGSRIIKMAEPDYDVIIIACGVGGHGAALHARANGLKTAILTGKDVGGTCVNRGCVP